MTDPRHTNTRMPSRRPTSALSLLVGAALLAPIAVANTAWAKSPSTLASVPIKDQPAKTGDSLYCQERGLGTNFYCEAPVHNETEEPEPQALPTPMPTAPVKSPEEVYLEAFQEELRVSRIKAIVDPSTENVTAYMQNQDRMLNLASGFADTFQIVGWQNPDISRIDSDPVSNVGISAIKAERNRALDAHLAKLSERYGLFYFYSGSCPACMVFGPLLDRFSQRHGIDVMAISMDGAQSTTFENWAPDNGIAEKMGLRGTITPAVILFDSKTGGNIPVSYGVISVEDLEKRINILTNEDNVKFLGGDDQ